MEEFFSFNVIYANGSQLDYETMPSVLPPDDSSLVTLNPHESLNINASSQEWWFEKGRHNLSALYFVTEDSYIGTPHWRGTVRANNISLFVE